MFLCFVVLLASNQIFTESPRDAARKKMHTENFQQHAAARLFHSNLRLTATHGFPRTFGPKACSLQERSLFCTTKTLERQVGRITNRLTIKCRCFISKVQKWETCNNACGTLRQSFGGTDFCLRMFRVGSRDPSQLWIVRRIINWYLVSWCFTSKNNDGLFIMSGKNTKKNSGDTEVQAHWTNIATQVWWLDDFSIWDKKKRDFKEPPWLFVRKFQVWIQKNPWRRGVLSLMCCRVLEACWVRDFPSVLSPPEVYDGMNHTDDQFTPVVWNWYTHVHSLKLT